MARTTKRSIDVNGGSFLWTVKPGGDGCLCIYTSDGKQILSYELGQARSYAAGWSDTWDPPFATVTGKEFSDLVKRSGSRSVQTPLWANDTTATPAFVAQLIEWALEAANLPASGEKPVE